MRLTMLIVLLILSVQAPSQILLIDTVRSLSGSSVQKFSRFEVGVYSVELTPDNLYNPFDSASADVYAIFTAPSGKKYRKNAFWMLPYSRCNTCTNNVVLPTTHSDYCGRGWDDVAEVMDPNDTLAYLRLTNSIYNWRIRFAPPEVGTWSYTVYANAGTNKDTSNSFTFSVTNSTDKGYVGHDTNHRYFQYKETGDVFIPLGLNSVKFNHEDTLYNRVAMSYATELISQMAPHGGNMVRIMMSPENFSIEWGKNAYGDGPWVYSFRQPQAFDLDSVLLLAEETNSYLHLVFDSQDELGKSWWWDGHPYNSATPFGFISTTDEFFTDSTARQAYKNRMRYIIARWGYSPHIFAFEPMQEVDGYGGPIGFWQQQSAVRDWYREMISYGKFLDTNHLYAASMRESASGANYHPNGVYDIPELDIVNDHYYGAEFNINFRLNYITARNRSIHPAKASYYGELGTSWGKTAWLGMNNFKGTGPSYINSDALYNNVDWHNAAWGSFLGGASAPALYWGSVGAIVHPSGTNGCFGGQYRYFEPIAKFIENEPIFLQQPKPISNLCSGRGRRDYQWYDTTNALMAFDTTTDPCGCYPRHFAGQQYSNPAYFTSGITTTQDSIIEVFALKAISRVIGWIHHKRNYWYDLPHQVGVNTSDPQSIADAAYISTTPSISNVPTLSTDSIIISNLAHGAYKLEFYSTYPSYEVDATHSGKEEGGVIPSMTDTVVSDCNGLVKFHIPTLRAINSISDPNAPDYGFKLSWISPVQTTHITSNTTWNSSSYISGDVTVDSNATLTIIGSSTVITMPKNSRILVSPGGKLVVDSATVTTDCDSMWLGIVAKGWSHVRQTDTAQPTVEIKNGATIEHARFAISVWDRSNINSTGGIIKATKSTFLNNNKSVEFQRYHNKQTGSSSAPKDNISFFSECKFEVNDSYKGEAIGNGFDAHVTMWEVEGVEFTACKFYNRLTSPTAARGYGIISFDAGYFIKPGCTNQTNPCNATVLRSDFEGFIAGIIAEAGLFGHLSTVSVDKADFDSNSIGIRVKHVPDISILRSRFNVGNGKEIGITDCYQNAGTYTTGVPRFRIEENDYNGYTHGGQQTGWINFGAITEESGGENNDIYKNTFDDLTHAAFAVGVNSDGVAPAPFNGLRYWCNGFDANEYDIAIKGPAPKGIATFQGAAASTTLAGLPAGNVFANSTVNILNQGRWITYLADSTNVPTALSGSVVNWIIPGTNSCASRISGGVTNLSSLERSTLINLKDSLRAALPGLKSTYFGLLDNGSTSAALTELSTMSPTEAYDYLHAMSPYASETVLRYAAENAVMNSTLMLEILKANPDALHNLDFIGELEVLGFDANELAEAAQIATEHTQQIAQIQHYEHAISNAYTLLIANVKTDRDYANINNIAEWLGEMNSLVATYELVEWYYSRGKNTEAAELFGDIPSNFELNSEEEGEYEAYADVFEILLDLKAENRMTLSDPEVSTLTTVSENFSGKRVAHIAEVAKTWYTTVPRLLCPPLPDLGSRAAQKPSRAKANLKNITVFPNPATDRVIFTYAINDASAGMRLSITDISGKTIKQWVLRGNKGVEQWLTSDIPNGVYIYNLSDGKKNHASGKVIIAK